MLLNTTGRYNTANGGEALTYNTTADYNTATGFLTMYNNSTGYENEGNGAQALFLNTTGHNNTADGVNSLYYNTTGNYNTALGHSAGNNSATTPSNFTAVGYNAGHVGSNSNTVEVGNSSVSYIGGQVSFSVFSDERIKDNIQADVPGLAFISKLRPVTYNLNIHRQNEMVLKGADTTDWEGKYDIEKIKMTGFIAQEVEKAAKESNYDFSGVQIPSDPSKLYSVRYAEFVVPLVKAVQELKAQNDELKKEIEELKKK